MLSILPRLLRSHPPDKRHARSAAMLPCHQKIRAGSKLATGEALRIQPVRLNRGADAANSISGQHRSSP